MARSLGGAAALFLAGVALGHRLEHRQSRRRTRQRLPDEPEAFESREPGRGRAAKTPLAIPHRGWSDIGWRVLLAYFGDRIPFIAGGVTFFVLLSLAPALSAFVSLYGLFAKASTAWDHLDLLYGIAPYDVAEFIGNELKRLAVERKGQLGLALLGSVALALWTVNTAVRMLFYGLNIAYHEVEKRNVVRYNLLCLAFTLGGLVFVLAATGLVVLTPLAINLTGLPLTLEPLEPLRWPLLCLIYWISLTLAYRYGPCRAEARWRWLTLGGVAGTVGIVGGSLLFSWYLAEVADFRRAYGSLGALMGFMLWTWISVQMVLLGAVLNAEVEHQTAIDTTTGAPLPLGERGAVMADTIGPRRGSPRALAYTLRHAEEVAQRAHARKEKRAARERRTD